MGRKYGTVEIERLEKRVKEKARKNLTVALRLDREDYVALLLLAESEGLNKSEMVRKLIRGVIDTPSPPSNRA